MITHATKYPNKRFKTMCNFLLTSYFYMFWFQLVSENDKNAIIYML